MKLCCFVILVFISVIFTVRGGEWGTGGIRGVNSLPITSINQNEEKSLTKRWHTNEKLESNYSNSVEVEEDDKRHPNSGPISAISANQTKTISSNNKGKEDEPQDAQSQNQSQNIENATSTAKKLEEEAQTINRVIVVLGSLGASLLLVAIAIAVLYWKVRRQQKLVRSVRLQEELLKAGGEGNINNNDNNINNGNNNNENGSGNRKGDTGSGVGDGEPSIDGNGSLLMSEKSIVINPNPSGCVNNGVGIGVVGDIVNNETLESRFIKDIPQRLSPQPTAPPAEKLAQDSNDLDINVNSSNLSAPPLTAPPAYSPTAPPIYALPYTPIELYSDENTYQQQDPHFLGNDNNNRGAFIRMPLTAWYAAGTTSQINIPAINDPYQQSNNTIIQPNPSSSTNLNSSFNSRENNDDNDRPTHQRQTI
ncbi:hypothetical protein RclHR1_08030014 [Rhizophagus clarus]|uniref:Mid2 domain-containing protein n=1 Tax=Rhizophagus clarus TaxID=94130 RepID=A0A2Z6SMF3_9GLOM|nr:hypothetical protein RclHR1_08030014 [Rhizophagus clarus]GES77371.1 hypothetical protein GLOIN_2v1620746 [Rhizophagus clarus]